MNIDVRFCCLQSPPLISTLQENAVKYRKSGEFVIFHIKESHPNYSEIEQTALEFKVTKLRTRVYTKQEMDNSEWFYMCSQCGKVCLVEDISFAFSCRQTFYYQGKEFNKFKHVQQISPLHTNKAPKWKLKNNFYSTDSGDFWCIFCSDYARDALEQSTAGLEFLPVMKGKTDAVLEDIHQLILPKNLPLEALEFDGQITVSNCPCCGVPLYDPIDPGTFIPRVRKEYLSDQCDYYATQIEFGPGNGHPLYIVSKKVYETAVKTLNERNLIFMPVEVL